MTPFASFRRARVAFPGIGAPPPSPTFRPTVAGLGMRTVVGCQDGSIYLLAGLALNKAVPAHTGPVNVLSCHAEGLASGGHDGLVKVKDCPSAPKERYAPDCPHR